MSKPERRLGILISGGGTTMNEIVEASHSGELPLDIACVIASKPGIGGIEKAQKLGVPIEVVDSSQYRIAGKTNELEFGRDLLAALRSHGADMVSQNGWLPMTPRNVIEAYENSIFNQHPGPVPEFGGKGMYGKRVHAAVLMFRRATKAVPEDMWTEVIGQRVSLEGATEYDSGKVLKSARVGILKGDEVDDLQQRALPVEHRVQIEMLKDAAEGKLVEVTRERIVKEGQEAILKQAKIFAAYLHPKG